MSLRDRIGPVVIYSHWSPVVSGPGDPWVRCHSPQHSQRNVDKHIHARKPHDKAKSGQGQTFKKALRFSCISQQQKVDAPNSRKRLKNL